MSKKAQHTPGPWGIIKQRAPNGGIYYRIYDKDEAGNVIAQIIGDGRIEYHENARLIAAAPDLLELARQIILEDEQNAGRLPADIVAGAASAIAKAEGKAP